jgi:hypothetical protein
MDFEAQSADWRNAATSGAASVRTATFRLFTGLLHHNDLVGLSVNAVQPACDDQAPNIADILWERQKATRQLLEMDLNARHRPAGARETVGL